MGQLFLVHTREKPSCPQHTSLHTRCSCQSMKAQISISIQQQMGTKTYFVLCVWSGGRRGDCERQCEDGIKVGGKGTAAFCSFPVRPVFWSKMAQHADFHFCFKKCLALGMESTLHMQPWGPFPLLFTIP